MTQKDTIKLRFALVLGGDRRQSGRQATLFKMYERFAECSWLEDRDPGPASFRRQAALRLLEFKAQAISGSTSWAA